MSGRSPDPRYGLQVQATLAAQQLPDLPVVLMMISNHYPMLYESPYRWWFVVGALLVGGLVRHYANQRNAGKAQPGRSPAGGGGRIGLGLVACRPCGRRR